MPSVDSDEPREGAADDPSRGREEDEGGRPWVVLVVDDNEDFRVLLSHMLTSGRSMLQVVTAQSGEEALALVPRVRPDAVITDLMMPRMNGFELCRHLRADPITATVPLVMVTANESPESRAEAGRVGVDDYLVKSFDREELTRRLIALLRQRRRDVGHVS
jgi:CheY-like chemotaxis protein